MSSITVIIHVAVKVISLLAAFSSSCCPYVQTAAVSKPLWLGDRLSPINTGKSQSRSEQCIRLLIGSLSYILLLFFFFLVCLAPCHCMWMSLITKLFWSLRLYVIPKALDKPFKVNILFCSSHVKVLLKTIKAGDYIKMSPAFIC